MHLRRWLPLLLVLLVGLALRLALWDNLPRQGYISDEAEYLAAADWLAHGRGFAWYLGWLWTRAPLYPLFLALHMALFGFNLTPIFISQTVLSLLNIALVSLLAYQVVAAFERSHAPTWQHTRTVPTIAALFAALYLPFALYPQIILSETLYSTLLLSACALLAHWTTATRRRWLWLLLAGGLLGLATLTRGLTLGFLPLVALWVLWVGLSKPTTADSRISAASDKFRSALFRSPFSLLPSAFFLLVCGATILPWSLYASRTYGGPVVVDTTGAFNLLLGARTAYDGGRSDAPTRNFVLALLDERLSSNERRELVADSCLYRRGDPRLLAALAQPASQISHAERQRLQTAEGLCLLAARPGAFVAKSTSELVDLFQINYTGAERMSSGFTLGRLPRWYALALFVLDDTLYVLLLPLAVVGWAVAWQRSAPNARWWQRPPLVTLIGLWWLYNLLTAPLLFAINRFRIPLLPFACIFAALALVYLVQRVYLWRSNAAGGVRLPRPALLLALLLATIAATPYAYLQRPPATWASYLGPYPASLVATRMDWQQRPTYLYEQQVIAALGRGDASTARVLLEARPGPAYNRALARPLLAGLEGEPQTGLDMLPDTAAMSATRNWRASVVRGDLLRRMGDEDGAKAAFTPGYVDDENPVAWAWNWLHPVPTRHIDLGGNLDLGYIQGFYLGEGDPGADGTFRWSTGEARLFFPAQARTDPQQVCLRVDTRGWPADLPAPELALALAPAHTAPPETRFALLPLNRSVQELCTSLPANLPASKEGDITLVLHSPTFVPPAADLLAQQGPQAGQLRLLGVRLDWVELR